MWQLGPAELSAVLKGAGTRESALSDERRELALYGAWHMAVWNATVKVGKLQDWSVYRQKLSGRPTPSTPAPSWQERKAELQRQADLLKKHEQQRHRLPKRRHG